jgi:hypothetical protein
MTTSTPRVLAHLRRRRERRGLFRLELPWDELRDALEAAGHLQGPDRYDDQRVRDGLQLWLDEMLAYGPRRWLRA